LARSRKPTPRKSFWFQRERIELPRYGSDQGTAWRALLPDSSWPVGAAQLGYGDGDEATVLHYGTNANNKYITTYFRHAFNVANAAAFTGDLSLSTRAR